MFWLTDMRVVSGEPILWFTVVGRINPNTAVDHI